MTYFELDPCICKQNQWRMGLRARDGKTEFHCFDCGAVTYVRLTEAAYRHLAGGDV